MEKNLKKYICSWFTMFQVYNKGWLDSWVGKICWRGDRLPTPVFWSFPGGLDGKESTCNAWVRSPGWEDPLQKGMATSSSIPAWRIPWTAEPVGSQRTHQLWKAEQLFLSPPKSSLRESRVIPHHLPLIFDWDGKKTDCEIFLSILIPESCSRN